MSSIQQTILNRGVAEVIGAEDLEKQLVSGHKLRVKLGIDPTSPNIHLGRSVPLLKLKDFQDAGHQIVFLIGDFTGVIGDTSDKDSERPMLTEEQVKQNMESYLAQAGKIIDVSKAEIVYNSTWLSKLGYKEIGKQADNFSINEFISRDNIRRRLEEGKRVSLREVLYPLMQGYDSVEIKADVEIGGTDQKFNLLAGRELQRTYGQNPQNIIMGPLIEGLDGRKMSSSWGNTVNVTDVPNEMFSKLMTLADEHIITYFTCVTRVSEDEIDEYAKQLEQDVNPRDIKMKLAFEIVSMYHSVNDAEKAQEYFTTAFTARQIPAEIALFKMDKRDLATVLVDSGAVPSKGEARRVIEQKGVRVNGEVVETPDFSLSEGDVIQKGKAFFLKVE